MGSFCRVPESVRTKDCVLVMPAVSHGNAGQLAVDLLLSTLLSKNVAVRLGTVDSEHLCPAVGADAFSTPPSGLTTGADVYHSTLHRLVLLQQRATVLPGHLDAYVADLLRWARGLGVRAILVLSGADAMVRLDSQMSGGPAVHHVATPDAAAAGLRLDAGLPSLVAAVEAAEARLPAHRSPFTAAVAAGAAGGSGAAAAPAGPPPACLAVMQSSGMATALLRWKWGGGEGPPVAVLLRHCFEGVNEGDGAVLASAAVHALALDLGEGASLKSPPSWAAPSPDAGLDATLFT